MYYEAAMDADTSGCCTNYVVTLASCCLCANQNCDECSRFRTAWQCLESKIEPDHESSLEKRSRQNLSVGDTRTLQSLEYACDMVLTPDCGREDFVTSVIQIYAVFRAHRLLRQLQNSDKDVRHRFMQRVLDFVVRDSVEQ
jgi:hypothetical protein